VIAGDFDIARAKAMVEKYFGGIAASTVPKLPDLTEPRQETEKRATKADKNARRPALAVAYHMPERNTPGYYAMGLLDEILLQGDDSLLYQELVRRRAYTGEVEGGINLLGNMFNYDGPMLWIVNLIHDPGTPPDQIVAALDSVIEQVRSKPLDQAAIDRALVKWRSHYYDSLTSLVGFGKADLLASFALFDDNPARINGLESEFRKVTPELIQKTAQEYLRSTNRTILTLTAAAAPAPGNGGAK
jgi:predicted Zn-dependent peptidase